MSNIWGYRYDSDHIKLEGARLVIRLQYRYFLAINFNADIIIICNLGSFGIRHNDCC